MTCYVSNLYSFVAVFRRKDETRQVSGQVQATEIPHQVPEDDGVLAEELVGVDHLVGHDREAGFTKEQTSQDLVSCVVAVWHLL